MKNRSSSSVFHGWRNGLIECRTKAEGRREPSSLALRTDCATERRVVRVPVVVEPELAEHHLAVVLNEARYIVALDVSPREDGLTLIVLPVKVGPLGLDGLEVGDPDAAGEDHRVVLQVLVDEMTLHAPATLLAIVQPELCMPQLDGSGDAVSPEQVADLDELRLTRLPEKPHIFRRPIGRGEGRTELQ